MERVYDVEGMHCAACTRKITAALEGLPGVARAEATLTPPQAKVEMSNPVPFDTLQAAVTSAGSYRLRERAERAPPTKAEEIFAGAPKESLYPLILIVSYLTGAVFLIETASGVFSLPRAMQNFMAGFFLVFSLFKMLDLRGFADAYRTYDLLAQAVPPWGWMYPFAELALGIAYLLGWRLGLTNVLTLILMLVGAIGVFRSLQQRRSIRCACLGTVLNLPMTTVTLVEDLGMAAMAAVMLFLK